MAHFNPALCGKACFMTVSYRPKVSVNRRNAAMISHSIIWLFNLWTFLIEAMLSLLEGRNQCQIAIQN